MPVFKGCSQRIDRIWPYKFSINKYQQVVFSCRALWGAAGSMTSWRSSFWTLQGKNPWRGVVWWSSAEVLTGSNAGVPCMKSRIVTKLMDMVWYGYIMLYTRSFLFMVYRCGWSHIFCEYGCSCWLSHASSPAHGRMLVFSFTLSLVTEWHSVTRSADFMEMANQPIGKFQDSLRAELKKVNQFACVSWLRQGCQGLSTSCVGKPVHAMLKTAEQICSLACHKLS